MSKVVNTPDVEISSITSADKLRAKWPVLDDLSRAEVIAALLQDGRSMRRLADQVGRPESSVRRLLQLVEATPDEKRQLRDKTLSTRQVVLKVRSRRTQIEEEDTANLQSVVGQQAESVEMISSWLTYSGVISGDAEAIIRHSMYILAEKSADWSMRQRKRLPVAELGESASLVEPGRVTEDPIGMVNARGIWLSQWLVKRYANPQDWISTLRLAIRCYTPVQRR